MKYLNTKTIGRIGIDWEKTIDVIKDAVICLDRKDFSQPIKPFLRYKDPENRIIAMPAYIGGVFDVAGIKWVASFPKNILRGIPRAHSVVILNDADTGRPIATMNTSLISIIRTASVSGLLLSVFQKFRKMKNIKIGIIGWGPIGQHHYSMCLSLLGRSIQSITLYDIRPINPGTVPEKYKRITNIARNWTEAYTDMDIVITCTVSHNRYINKPPKKGGLLLNVSLRDYRVMIYNFVKGGIVVDDWEEVCRENTDIEQMHLKKGLVAKDTLSLIDVVVKKKLENISKSKTIMFNPMGMGVFDVAIAKYYYDRACKLKIGTDLE